MNYDELKPGRALDAEVAKKVMGIDLTGARPDLPIRGIGCAPYSTDIAAAWEVVEKMIELGCPFVGVTHHAAGMWSANFDEVGRFDFDIIPKDAKSGFHRADTALHAICIAALKATETQQ